jgi:hypothetical protein
MSSSTNEDAGASYLDDLVKIVENAPRSPEHVAGLAARLDEIELAER